MTELVPTDTKTRDLIRRLADELDHYRQLLMDDRRETHALATEARAALAQTELQELSDLRARVETLEDAAHKQIVETRANILALASRVDALELTERRLSKALDISDLPQLTPEQVQNLQDLLGTYRNHLGLNN
jgi:chromosome segregation ATPase